MPLRNPSLLKTRNLVIVAAISSCFASAPVWANPTGPQVVNGSASISQAGKLLTVTNSSGTIINWNTFSIGVGETTRFNQSSASSSVLNRVLANDPSVLLGTLSSNGKVWLVNPAGIMVGQGARIDVAGFVASTLNVRNEDFLAGRLNFQATPSAGKLDNSGQITTPSGGSVYLIGPSVTNNGIINAPNGDVLLAAGQTVQLIDTGTPGVRVEITGTEGSATNLGQIVAEAGRIGMAGVLVRNSGDLNASSVVNDGGRIFLKATKQIDLTDSSAINADGTKGGNVVVITERDGQIAGELIARGNISAKGDGSRGSGGFVETSARTVDINSVQVNTAGGTWLLDPDDVEINTSGTISGATLVLPGTIANALDIGNDFVIQTNNAVTGGNGDITVNSGIAKSTNNASSLSFVAANNVDINAPINLSAGNGSFNVSAGGNMTVNGASVDTGGSMTLNITGGLSVQTAVNSSARANLSSENGQTIAAKFVEVIGRGLGQARIRNNSISGNSSNQNITVSGVNTSGESIVVKNLGTGAAAIIANGVAASTGQQYIIVKGSGENLLRIIGASGNAVISANGTNAASQTISVTGGASNTIEIGDIAGGATVGVSRIAGNNQSITAGIGAEPGAIKIRGGAVGGANSFIENWNGTYGQNMSTSGSIEITGGTAANGSSAMISSLVGQQTVTAKGMTILGGASGNFNRAYIQADDASANQSVTAGRGGITLKGGAGGNHNIAVINHQGYWGGNQTITVNDGGGLTLTGGAGGIDNYVVIDNKGVIANQAVTIDGGGVINIAGGNGTNNSAGIATAGTSQTVSVSGAGAGINLTGGISGSNNAAGISTSNNSASQSIIAGSGGIALTGGVGGTSNLAQIGNSGNQEVTISDGGSLTLTGGAGGTNSSAQISQFGASGNQTVTINGGGTLSLTGGGGAANYANVFNGGLAQSITFNAGGALNLLGGFGAGGGNSARIENIGANATTQTITGASGITLAGGTNAVGGINAAANEASIYTSGTSQVVSASGISLSGGASGSGNYASIQTTGFSADQSITAGGGIILAGGIGGVNNGAQITQIGSSGNQTVTIDGGGALRLTGGGGAANYANISNGGLAQSITFNAGGALDLQGGSGGGGGNSVRVGNRGDSTSAQTITGASAIDLRGGTGGAGNSADIFAETSSQTIGVTAAGGISLVGGANGSSNYSNIQSNSPSETQSISVGSGGISLAGGIGGDYNNVMVWRAGASGNQVITISNGGKVNLTGGGGTNNYVGFENRGANQLITFTAGGELNLQGGWGASRNGANIGNSRNGAILQEIAFAGGGAINLTGGTIGNSNSAGISVSSGDQTISGNPNITVTGGASGGINGAWNHALFGMSGSANGVRTMDVNNLALIGGAGGEGNGAYIASSVNGQKSIINASGSVNFTGGAGLAAGAYISSSTADIDVVLNAVGPVTFAAGSGTDASYRRAGAGIGTRVGEAKATINAQGDIIFTDADATADSIPSVGSLSSSGGVVVLNAGLSGNGSLLLDYGQVGAPGSSVTLKANATGGQIRQTNGRIIADSLSTSSNAGTLLAGANQVSSFNATNSTSGNITLVNGVPLDITGIANNGNSNGNITVDNTGAVIISGPVLAPNGVISIIAHSPLTIGGGGNVSAGGNIILTAGQTTAQGDDLVLRGPVSTTGRGASISMFAGDNLLQNANVTSNRGAISAISQSGNINMALGAATISNGGSISYAAPAGNVTLTSLDVGRSGEIALDVGGSIGVTQGFTGANLIGRSAVIKTGGDAYLSTQIRRLDVTVGGLATIKNLYGRQCRDPRGGDHGDDSGHHDQHGGDSDDEGGHGGRGVDAGKRLGGGH